MLVAASRRHVCCIPIPDQIGKFGKGGVLVNQFTENHSPIVDVLALASSSRSRFNGWERGLCGLARTFRVAEEFDALKNTISQSSPQLLLLDYELHGLDGANGTACLKRLFPETRIIVSGNSLSDDAEWELFKIGVRGCCRSDIDPQFLKGIVVAVQQGELWIRRTLTYRLLDELKTVATGKHRIYRAELGLLDSLTQREYEIAVRAGNGENNKQISEGLEITERTVKAHLTEIFRKLGIADRLKLVLVLSADQRQARRLTPSNQ
jgi:two-component system NarL family response regulator